TSQMNDLLTMAEQQNPSLKALRAREGAAAWGVRAASSSYGPALSVSAGWAGFTQQFTNVDPIIFGQQAAFARQYTECQANNTIRTSSGLAPEDCSAFIWSSQN